MLPPEVKGTEPPRPPQLLAQIPLRRPVPERDKDDRDLEEEGEGDAGEDAKGTSVWRRRRSGAAAAAQRSFSFDGSKEGLGNFIFIDSSVSSMISATARLRNHFRSAGMMCQGAQSVLHLESASW